MASFESSSSPSPVQEFKDLLKLLIGNNTDTDTINSWNEEDIEKPEWNTVFELAQNESVRNFCLDECNKLMSELTNQFKGRNLKFKSRPAVKEIERLVEKADPEKRGNPYKAIQDLSALRIIGYNIDDFKNIGIKVLEHIKSKKGSVYKHSTRPDYGNRERDLMYRLFVYTPDSTIHEVQILHPFAEWVFTYNSVNRSISNEKLYKPMKIPYKKDVEVKRQKGDINLENCSIYDAMKHSIQNKDKEVAEQAKRRYIEYISNKNGNIPDNIIEIFDATIQNFDNSGQTKFGGKKKKKTRRSRKRKRKTKKRKRKTKHRKKRTRRRRRKNRTKRRR